MVGKREQLIAAIEAYRDRARSRHDDDGRQQAPRSDASPEPIALIGLAGYLPGCKSVGEFWTALDQDAGLIEEVPISRFDWRGAGGPGEDEVRQRIRWGGFVPGVELFDPEFFGIPMGEAERMDPRQRLLLMSVYNAIEDAGYAPWQFKEARTGVFVAVEDGEYVERLRDAGIEVAEPFSHAPSMVSSRISYAFDFDGPSEVVNTMCSGVAVAIHKAVMALRAREVDQAVVGAANLILRPHLSLQLARLGQLAPANRVASFGEGAAGYLRAEGVASIVLRRSGDALRDGDPIHAFIRHSVVGFNGRGGTSIAAPNVASHSALVASCYEVAGADPRDIGWIEAQGMGNPVADIAEWSALNRALRVATERRQVSLAAGSCVVSTLKPTMGHMHCASALGALFKVIRGLHTGRIPPIRGFERPNEFLEVEEQPCRLAVGPTPWPRRERPRLVGLHSYGSSAVNAHLLIEDAPIRHVADEAGSDRSYVVPLSAARQDLLAELVVRLRAELALHPEYSLASVARTLQRGRDALSYRLAFVADTPGQLARQLSEYREGRANDDVHAGTIGQNAMKAATARAGRWPARGLARAEARELARAWVGGDDLRWDRTYDASAGAPVLHLPGYPFAKRRCWVEPELGRGKAASSRAGVEASAVRSAASTADAAERCLFQLQRVESGARELRLCLEPRAFYFEDHRVGGDKVLPGAAFVEIAAAAALAEEMPSIRRMTRLVWPAPIVATGGEVRVAFGASAGSGIVDVELFGPDARAHGGRITHVRARIETGTRETGPRIDLGDLLGRCPLPLDPARVYAIFEREGLGHGSSFRGIERCRMGESEAVSEVQLPMAVAHGERTAFHPVLVDCVLQTGMLLLLGAGSAAPGVRVVGGPMVPFSIDEVRLYGELPRRLTVHARRALGDSEDSVKVDIDACDESGQVKMVVRGLRARRKVGPGVVRSPARANARLDLRIPIWIEAALRSASPSDALQPASIVLVLGDRLRVQGAERLPLAALSPPEVLIEALDALRARLQRAIAEHPGGRGWRVEVWCDPTVHPAVCDGVASFLRSVRREDARLTGKVVRIEGGADDWEALVHAERTGGAADDLVVYRSGRRYVRSAAPLDLATAPPIEALNARNRVFCILGGGAIGTILARWLANELGARVLLASRSAERVNFPGNQVSSVAVDVTDARSMDDLIARLEGEPDLEGIFFTAGVIEPGPALEKDRAGIRRVVAPKCIGAFHLLERCNRLACKYVTLFSSQASQGEPRHADYAAANGFLNTLARDLGPEGHRHLENSRGDAISVVSIAWSAWAEGGMRLSAEVLDALRQTRGIVPLPSAVAFEALGQIVRSGSSEVSVEYRVLEEKVAATVARAVPPAFAARAENVLREVLGAFLERSVSDLDMDAEFADLGLDSIAIVNLASELEKRQHVHVEPANLFECRSLRQLHGHVARMFAAASADVAETSPVAGAGEPAVDASRGTRPVDGTPVEPIAIVGMHGRFPRAADLDEFWDNIERGRNCITPPPVGRAAPGDPPLPLGGYIDGVDRFDAAFFSIAPAEAEWMDPQQRLMLMSVWAALEHGGLVPEEFARRTTGVFVAAAHGEYERVVGRPESHPLGTTGVSASMAPNRISHVFNFQGPSEYCDTACSSAITALHRAAGALRAGECEQAIVSAVNLLLLPDRFAQFRAMDYLSLDGESRSFQKGASGFVRGEGVGSVVLKPLRRAIEDGDIVFAVLRGSGVFHGGRGLSLTAPSAKGMKRAVLAAHRESGVDPRSLAYVELHGVALPMSDATEIGAIRAAHDDAAPAADGLGAVTPCFVGSLKPCVGHGEIVSGMTALLKVVCAIRHRVIPGLPRFTQVHDAISLEGSRLRISPVSRAWGEDAGLRRAAVNSFGFGGVNAYAILEEMPPGDGSPRAPEHDQEPRLFVFSAKSSDRLEANARNMLGYLGRDPTPSARDVAYTLQVGRQAFSSRLAIRAAGIGELKDALRTYLESPTEEHLGERGIYTATVDPNGRAARLFRGKAGELVAERFIHEGALDRIGEYWVLGGEVPWRLLHGREAARRVPLPAYAFSESRYWVAAPPAPRPLEPSEPLLTEGAETPPGLAAKIRSFLSQTLSVASDQIAERTELSGLGVDSIVLMRLARVLEEWTGVAVPLHELHGLDTITQLVSRVERGAVETGPARESAEGPRTLALPPEQAALDALDLFKLGLLPVEEVEARVEEGAYDAA